MGLFTILNKKIINVYGNTIGLDLSDLSVKVVQLEKRGKGDSIVSIGTADIPAGSISSGEIVEKDKVVQAIKDAIASAKPRKMTAKNVICSLPETKAFLRVINIPKMKKEEVAEAIKWEVEANIPLSIDQVYYDWQILEKNFSQEKNKESVLIVAVAQKVVNQFLEVLEQVGLEVINMEIESIAQSRSLLGEEDSGKTTLIIDIGDKRTSFLISLDNVPCFTSSIPLSAGSLTDAISKSLSVDIDEAEKKKIEYGIGSPEKVDPIFKAVQPILENLVSEIEKSIDFYLTGLRYSSSIDKVIICGGGSKTKGISSYLSKRLNKEIVSGDPWINLEMKKNLPVTKGDESVQYSTSIGLAIKGMYENFN